MRVTISDHLVGRSVGHLWLNRFRVFCVARRSERAFIHAWSKLNSLVEFQSKMYLDCLACID